MRISAETQLGLSISSIGLSGMAIYYFGAIASPTFSVSLYMFSLYIKKTREESPNHIVLSPPPPILFSREAFRIIDIPAISFERKENTHGPRRN